MREGLRSSSLSKRDNKVDLSHDDGDLGLKNFVDVNRRGDLDAGSSEEGVESCCEVSKTDGKANGPLSEREAVGDVEGNGIEVNNECREIGSGSVECGSDNGEGKEVDRALQDCSTTVVDNGNKIDDCCGILGQDADMGGGGKEGLSCDVDLGDHSDSGVLEIEDDKERRVCGGETVDVKEKNFESVAVVDDEALCSPVIVRFGTFGERSGTDSPSCIVVDDDKKTEDMEEHVHYGVYPPQLESGMLVESRKEMGGVEGSECKFEADDWSDNLTPEVKQGTVLVVGKVLRSRVVPASGIGEDSGCAQKRKRGTDGSGEAAIMKDENEKSSVGYERLCKRRSPKKSNGHSEEEIVQVNDAPLVSKAEGENAIYNSVGNSNKKGKRGRPKKYVDCVEEEEVPICKAKAESEVEDENFSRNSVRTPTKKGKRGRPKKYESEVEDESFGRNSLRTPKKKGKRGRPKKLVDHSAGEETQKSKTKVGQLLTDRSVRSSKEKKKRGRPRKLFHCPEEGVGCQVEKETRGVIRRSVRQSMLEHKCGRPKRYTESSEEEVAETKKVRVSEVDDDDEDEDGDEDEDTCNESVRNRKTEHKRGRPKRQERCNEPMRTPKKEEKCGRHKRQEGDDAEEMIYHDKGKMKDARKMKVSLVTAPVRRNRLDSHPGPLPDTLDDSVPSKKGISSDGKITSGGLEKIIVDTSSTGEETPFPKNKSSGKRKKVKTVGSAQAEKNSIRKQIVDMLLGAGWKVDYRPRQGKQYKDAVYVNPEGKTHWSVTKAYFSFKQEVEEGELRGNPNFCFTPIPEEVLSKLFKVVSKTRSDKNMKKKHKNNTGDSSDEEFFKDEPESAARGKEGAKGRHSVAKRKPSDRHGSLHKRRCALLARLSSQGSNSESDGVIAYAGKHSVLAWMIDSGIISLDAKLQYMNSCRTKSMLEGSVTRDGIHCSCCKKVISLAEFEKHAESSLCEPYENVYLVNGKSLLQCQVDSWNKQQETGRTGYYSVPDDGDDPNDDTCGICGDGGDLVCCDGCPSTFHHGCLNIEEVPSGEWLCVYCSCKFCGGGETASKRDGGCDTTVSSFITCSLCDEKYHQSCIDEADNVCVNSGQPTFCGRNCEQIFARLQLLFGARHDIGDGYSWTFLQRSDVEADAFPSRAQNILSNSKLAVALSIMDECFLPIIDPRSGIDLIRHIVYSCGSNFNRLNFSNFFTVILERGDEVISAASVRIHGKRLAEMPFIGTRNVYRRQGMCRRLVSAIELALGSLDIEKLVIPAIPELLHTWTSVFGFEPVEESVKAEMRSINMLVFPYTGMLYKLVSKDQLVRSTIDVTEEKIKCCESEEKDPDGGVDKLEADNGCTSGIFDLNCAAADVPDSSFDDKHLIQSGSAAGNCENEVKSGANFEGMADRNKFKIYSSPTENDGHQDKACALGLQPDLNLMEQDVLGESRKPGLLKGDEINGPALINSDQAVKITEHSFISSNVEMTSGVNLEAIADGNEVEIYSTPNENDDHQDVLGESRKPGLLKGDEINGPALINSDQAVKITEHSFISSNVEMTSGVNLEAIADGNEVEIYSTPRENDDHQDGACAVGLQPDLNLVQQDVFGESREPGLLKDDDMNGPSTVNSDKVVKSTEHSFISTDVEITSGVNVEAMANGSKDEIYSTPKENDDHQDGACAVGLQPDLNLVEPDVFGESQKPGLCKDNEIQLHHGSATMNTDKVEKSMEYSYDSTNIDGTNCNGVSAHQAEYER